ncbi:hypothetical protein GCM10009678_46890 [Actinomadura kijaniata]|uniref:Uncharacterized protein n=1 Tax=Actinomadura namibiensis TaxID=182080 RepID=A0A7W3LKW5_ACTNM|nr:hypothetical protein [Actinomadura namibiensis]MBA8950001.1 hypothetical protein [Actinomadura namibiensis]
MNDLDLDRLRADLHALADRAGPTDLRERALRTSRVRRRRHRAATALTAVAALVLAAFALLPGDRDEPPVLRPTPAPSGAPPGKSFFFPPTRSAGGRETMYLELPDGTAVDVSYPKDLALAHLGFMPSREVEVPEDATCCAGFTSLKPGARLHGTLPDRNGRPLEIWLSPPVLHPEEAEDEFEDEGKPERLYVRVGHWYVPVGEGVPDASAWARLGTLFRALELSETARGHLMIKAVAPVRLVAVQFTGGDVWGSGPTLASQRDHRHRRVEVARVDRCAPDTRVDMELTGWQVCRDGVAVRFLAEEKHRRWADRLHKELRIERVRPAG